MVIVGYVCATRRHILRAQTNGEENTVMMMMRKDDSDDDARRKNNCVSNVVYNSGKWCLLYIEWKAVRLKLRHVVSLAANKSERY